MCTLRFYSPIIFFIIISIPVKAQNIKLQTNFEDSKQITHDFGKQSIKRIHNDLFDHTRQGDSTHYAELLTGKINDQIGLTSSFIVKAGDTLELNVYAKYRNGGYKSALVAVDNILMSFFLITMPVSQSVEGVFRRQYGAMYGDLSPKNSKNESAPAAYLNWLIFDENFLLMDGGFTRIDGQNIEHTLLSSGKLPIKKKGYVYSYLSNELDKDVYFDDFSADITLASYISTESDEDILTEDDQNILIE